MFFFRKTVVFCSGEVSEVTRKKLYWCVLFVCVVRREREREKEGEIGRESEKERRTL